MVGEEQTQSGGWRHAVAWRASLPPSQPNPVRHSCPGPSVCSWPQRPDSRPSQSVSSLFSSRLLFFVFVFVLPVVVGHISSFLSPRNGNLENDVKSADRTHYTSSELNAAGANYKPAWPCFLILSVCRCACLLPNVCSPAGGAVHIIISHVFFVSPAAFNPSVLTRRVLFIVPD